MMTICDRFEADSIDFLAGPTVFKPGVGATTLVGGSATVSALNLDTGAKVAGSATINTDSSITCFFQPWSLAAGNYEVQVVATPLTYRARTVAKATFVIRPSAGVKPS